MNADYINPFVQGSQNILNILCHERITLGNLFIKKPPYLCEEVSIVIGIIGEVTGNVIYNFKKQTACNIASKMMRGAIVEELDDISKSAISELTNMISGNVATVFSGKGINIDITTPKLFLYAKDTSFDFIKEDSKFICVPLVFANGDIFEVDILLLT